MPRMSLSDFVEWLESWMPEEERAGVRVVRCDCGDPACRGWRLLKREPPR